MNGGGKVIGIYGIRNINSGKIYIGKSTDIKSRFSFHKSKLKHNKHFNDHLQEDWNLYGEFNFEFIILEECLKEELNEKEIIYVKKIKEENKIYNMRDGGAGGKFFDDYAKNKLSKSNSGKTTPEDVKEKISEALRGIKRSEETKQKLSQIANCRTDEQIQKTAEARRKAGYNISEEQLNHMKEIGRSQRLLAKLTIEDVLEIKKMLACGKKDKEIAPLFNVSSDAIRNIRTGRRWSWL